MQIKHSIQKNFRINPSGRSTDWISPDFILNCGYGCHKSYCYVQRKQMKYVYVFTNVEDILNKIQLHYSNLSTKEPNQCGKLWSYDIGCNSDIALYSQFIPLQEILDFFKANNIMSSFATKRVNYKLLKLNVDNNYHRIRFSLMPQNISDKLESKTDKIIDRIKAINIFIKHGWDVHINFSPIVVYQNWLEDYKRLFELIKQEVKYDLFTENIFLTHNEVLHNINTNKQFKYEHLLWQPVLQENKISQSNSENIRYKALYKQQWIDQFSKLQKEILNSTIRYIF